MKFAKQVTYVLAFLTYHEQLLSITTFLLKNVNPFTIKN
jgi:hypothetical protein